MENDKVERFLRPSVKLAWKLHQTAQNCEN